MYSVHDWAEVRRLHHVEGMSKAAIAAKLSMSRNTVTRLLSLPAPPKYERARAGSALDRFAGQIAAWLEDDATVPATVITERLRPLGYSGSVTVVKDHVRQVRPAFAAAQSFQRTSYVPGQLAQTDWWHTGVRLPVGRSQTREAFGLVTGLPFSACFRVVFAFQRTTAAFLPALLGGLGRLGGLPSGLVFDNDSGIVASRSAGQVRLVDEVASTLGQLSVKGIPLRPSFPQGKGFIERAVGYLQTSWLPLRRFTDLADMQAQADGWSRLTADSRHVRRLGGTVRDAHGVELEHLRPLPAIWPDVDARLEVRASRDGFVRVGDVDYSVPPRLAGRRLAVRASLAEVLVFCDGSEVARHPRSWARADVRLHPQHARELRLAREAKRALAAGDLTVDTASLADYDALTGLAG
jgi:transposase